MINNGYQLIDLKGVEIDTTGVKIPGIYSMIEGLRKLPIFINANIDDVGEFAPFTSSVYSNESVFHIIVTTVVSSTDGVSMLELTVEDDDTVTQVQTTYAYEAPAEA